MVKDFTVRKEHRIAEVLAGRERDEKGRIPKYWTPEKAISESKKYKTRKSFALNCQGGYQYLVRKKLLHLISFEVEVKRHFIPDFEVICAIKSCKTRTEMSERFSGEYSAVFRRKYLKEIYHEHFGRGKTSKYWNHKRVRDEALKYSTKGEFSKKSSGAYEYAINNGILDDVCAHMEVILSDYNCVYIWKVSGRNIYKVGVTSERLGEERIYSVSRKSGLPAEGIIISKSGRALEAEKELMKIGLSANFHGFNGSSEFRVFSDNDYKKAYRILYEYSDRAEK